MTARTTCQGPAAGADGHYRAWCNVPGWRLANILSRNVGLVAVPVTQINHTAPACGLTSRDADRYSSLPGAVMGRSA